MSPRVDTAKFPDVGSGVEKAEDPQVLDAIADRAREAQASLAALMASAKPAAAAAPRPKYGAEGTKKELFPGAWDWNRAASALETALRKALAPELESVDKPFIQTSLAEHLATRCDERLETLRQTFAILRMAGFNFDKRTLTGTEKFWALLPGENRKQKAFLESDNYKKFAEAEYFFDTLDKYCAAVNDRVVVDEGGESPRTESGLLSQGRSYRDKYTDVLNDGPHFNDALQFLGSLVRLEDLDKLNSELQSKKRKYFKGPQ